MKLPDGEALKDLSSWTDLLAVSLERQKQKLY